MTSRIAAIIEKSPTDIHYESVIKAEVSRMGSRMIDTATLTLPAGSNVAINDIVSYIQDDVPLENLTALWNFQGSTRDESGYHHDGVEFTDSPNTGYRNLSTLSDKDEGYITPNNNDGNTRKFRACYGLTFSAAGQEVRVNDVTSNNAELDFTKQFDIIINFKNMRSPTSLASHWNGTTNTHMVLFSKYDTTNNRGVMIGIKKVGSTNTGTTAHKWVIWAKLDTTEFEGDGTLINGDGMTAGTNYLGRIQHAQDKETRMIRFYRDENDIVRLSLDNIMDGDDCKKTPSAQNTRATAPLYFGTSNENVEGTTTNNYDFEGHLFQIRVYCGGYLKEEHIENLVGSGAQQMTQKVSGVVWDRKDKLKNITIAVKSRSRSILDSSITYDNISNTISSGSETDQEPATHIKNLFEGGQDMSDVLKTIVYNIDSDFAFHRNPSTNADNGTHADSKYLAEGSFIKNVEILMLMARNNFLTFPTKTFLWEYGAHEHSNMTSGYEFNDNQYQMFDRGENDMKVVNDIEIIGDIQSGYKETNFGTVSGTGVLSTKFTYPPLNLQLVKGSASTPDGASISQSNFWVDQNTRELTITSTSGLTGSDYVWGRYNFEITANLSNAAGGNDFNKRHIKLDADDCSGSGTWETSLAKYGRRQARLYVPQLLRQQDFNSFGQALLKEKSAAKKRYTIKAPTLINCLRENLEIKLKSTKMKFSSISSNGTDNGESLSEISLPIVSIIWRFPECTTTIEVGEHDWDMFDFDKDISDESSNIISSTYVSRSNA